MKKHPFKILTIFLTVILMFSVWIYFIPKVTVKNENLEIELKPKFHSCQDNDSLFVFIPYKFSIKNNSLKNLKLKEIFCEENYDGTLYSQLIYSQEGHESLMGDEYNDFKNENIIKPFQKKFFYYFLKSKVPKKDFDNAEFVEDLSNKLPAEIIEKHIENLRENVKIEAKINIISKLYNENKNKDVFIILSDNTEVKIENYTVIDKKKYEENYKLKTKL